MGHLASPVSQSKATVIRPSPLLDSLGLHLRCRPPSPSFTPVHHKIRDMLHNTTQIMVSSSTQPKTRVMLTIMTSLVSNIPKKHFATFIALCCWQLWKRRNAVVFRSERAGHQPILAACICDAKLWKSRLPKKDRELAERWIGVFTNAM
jgi:hypothetical protein